MAKIYVSLTKDNYYTGCMATVGSISGGVQVDHLPPDLVNCPSTVYKLDGDNWIFDLDKYAEYVNILVDAKKEELIIESKAALADFLAMNPVISDCHGGVKAKYTITQEKQSLMISQFATYQIEKALNPNAVIRWNASGESCEDWTEEEFIILVLTSKAVIYPLVSRQQYIEEVISSCSTLAQLNAIKIDYSDLAGDVLGEVVEEQFTFPTSSVAIDPIIIPEVIEPVIEEELPYTSDIITSDIPFEITDNTISDLPSDIEN